MFLGVAGTLAFIVATALVTHPRLFYMAADAIGAAYFWAALSHGFVAAFREEAGKALGFALAKPRQSRFTWFWLAVAAAAGFGVIERWLMHLNRVPNDAIAPVTLLFYDIRAVAAHIALSLLCVATVRLAGGKATGWAIGIFVAGTLHGLHNFLLLRFPVGFAGSVVTAVIFFAIMVAAYLYRYRLDWRATAAK